MAAEHEPHRLTLMGELSIFTAQAGMEQLGAALAAGGAVEVDLSAVTEIDSAGLQLLIAAKREAALRNQALHFSGHSAPVVDLLDLCDLAGFFGDPVLMPRQ